MDGNHERSLVAWAKTFSASFPVGAAQAECLGDFADGDALIPIARTIVGNDDDDRDRPETAVGWASVFFHMQPVGLVEENAQVPYEDDQRIAMAVTCLEALLRHTVGEHCAGRETFIRQIMSLDADAQATLRHIIVGEHPQQHDDASSSEAGSPSRDGGASSFAGSPAPSAAHSPPASTGGLHTSMSSDEGNDSSHSGEDDLSLRSWYSPHPKESARRQSRVMTGGRTGERAAPVGPKPRRGRTLDMEEAEQVLVGATAASAASFSPAAEAGGASGWTATAVEVVDLKAEVSRLKAQLEDTEQTRAEAVAVVEAQREAAADRQEELREDLRRARQAAERLTVSEEDAVIAVERDMRAKYERELAVLQERASNAEERVFTLGPLEDEVLRLRDEVDILRPAEAKLSKVEDNLSRCREKIEELSGLPGQLKREEDAHAKVLDHCLELETEVAQIPQLKRQVDRYRRSHTDMEVANREQSRELEMAREEVSRLSQEVHALADGSQAARNEQQRLQEELKRRAMEDAEGGGDGGGVGEGVSELNPVLTEELARLRRTNELLAAKVDYNTEETIRELEQKADDANRLADSFHDSLASERGLRAAAETSLAAARARIAELEAEIAALRAEHLRTVAYLEADAERQAEGLRGEMEAAAEAAAAAAARVDEERSEERAELRAEMEAAAAAAAAAAARAEEHAAGELAAAQQARALEKRELEGLVDRERKEAARKEAEAVRGLAEARRVFDSEVADINKEFHGELEEGRRSAADEIAVARERTAKEEEGRLEESRMKEEAKQQIRQLEKELSAGKQAALKAIGRLETNARELRAESALARREQEADHHAKMEALTGEFDKYRETHTVDDASYHHDMDQWEMSIATKKKLIGDLRGQVDALEKDKRRLEREKTFYWGQAEELRMSATAGGRADPTRDADHLQLVEQTRELIEENRRLRQRAQDNDDGGGMSTRSGGRWGGSGVAAMRAEHEAEMTALKEEKQDMLLKYHATSAKLNDQERRCAELSGEVEEMRAQIVSLQLINKRQEKKLRDSTAFPAPAAAAVNNSIDDPSTHKENQAGARAPSSLATNQLRSSNRGRSKATGIELSLKSVKVSRKGGVSKDDGAAAIGTLRGGRGPLRGLGNARQQQQEGSGEVSEKVEAMLPQDAGVAAVGGDTETPPECVQS